ncbi:MAG: hypothetical protein AAFR73_05730 [Pseudomonadota bacterium]
MEKGQGFISKTGIPLAVTVAVELDVGERGDRQTVAKRTAFEVVVFEHVDRDRVVPVDESEVALRDDGAGRRANKNGDTVDVGYDVHVSRTAICRDLVTDDFLDHFLAARRRLDGRGDGVIVLAFGASNCRVAARPAVDRVAARAADEQVATIATVQKVVTLSAVGGVVARARLDRIVARQPVDLVVTAEAPDDVIEL